jgi:hypothetical protein
VIDFLEPAAGMLAEAQAWCALETGRQSRLAAFLGLRILREQERRDSEHDRNQRRIFHKHSEPD